MNRRTAVPFDPYYFHREAQTGRRYSTTAAFRHIYASNHWAASARSGGGASFDQAAAVLRQLEALIEQLDVRTLLDVPCGDFAWMQHLRSDVRYIGGDVLPELVVENERRWSGPRRRFVVIDILKDDLPDAELLLCRDCLVHFSFDDIGAALRNISRSRCRWLLATTFPDCATNEDIVTGDWRPVNLERPPFNLPPPQLLLNEQCTEAGDVFADKSLGLWDVEDLALA
jgi:hypothetical protein